MNGETVEYVWDYDKDEPVEKSKFEQQQWVKSERKKYEKLLKKKQKEQVEKDQTTLF